MMLILSEFPRVRGEKETNCYSQSWAPASSGGDGNGQGPSGTQNNSGQNDNGNGNNQTGNGGNTSGAGGSGAKEGDQVIKPEPGSDSGISPDVPPFEEEPFQEELFEEEPLEEEPFEEESEDDDPGPPIAPPVAAPAAIPGSIPGSCGADGGRTRRGVLCKNKVNGSGRCYLHPRP